MPELRLSNWRLGMRRDSALRDDAMISARTLENFSISYAGESARLRIRNGYTRWNTNALGAPADQIYMFSDMLQNEHLLGIYNSRWYELNQVAAHEQLINVAATARRPILQFGNRCFFWTDDDGDGLSGYWTDDTQLNGAPKAFRLGIKKPAEAPTLVTVTVDGHLGTPAGASFIELNPVAQRRVGIQYDCAYNMTVDHIFLSAGRFTADQENSGSIRAKFYTDNAGEPSTTLADPNAVSDWMSVNRLAAAAHDYKRLLYFRNFELDAGTTYWIVIEGDEAYYDNHVNLGGAFDFYASIGHESAPGSYKYGQTLVYSQATTLWSALTKEAIFYIGALVADTAYGYVYTYLNSTYGSESRPSPEARIEATGAKRLVNIANYTAPGDAQADSVRIYRREMADIDDDDADITDPFKFVAEYTIALSGADGISIDFLGAELQTTDHYCLDDTDDTGQGLRDAAIFAKYAVLWKGRLWIAEADSNALYFSKTLEKDGATGLIGESAEDYFPLGNKQELPVPAGIIGIRPLSNDQLVVYFEDESVWLIYGGDEALNPPSDLIIREVLTTNGLIATAGITDLDGRHIYLGRDGLYAFAGTQMLVPEYLSETNQSILDAIQRQYLESSVLHTVGREIWVAYDSDNDGTLDKFLILDLQRDVPTRQLYDRAWRTYDYGLGFNDFVVVSSGNQFRKIYAADADNAYILELESGNLDNNLPIVGLLETHDLTAEELVMINQLDIDAYYPASPPTYRITLTDHLGFQEVYDFDNIGGSDDIRGHRMGVRLRSPVSVRLQLEQWSTNNDELRAITLGYTTQ